ncbi:MAG TPA: hypothetical protein VKH16_02680 [Gemmatimonadales bacterium]|nr:hypothetical protein [Gemmatimonadales bacterium]
MATEITVVPSLPPLVAVIMAVPGATGVTKPLVFVVKPAVLTVATVVSLLVQVTTQPGSTLPAMSWGIAVTCTAWPTGALTAVGRTLTTATPFGGGGCTTFSALQPPSTASKQTR